MSCQIRAALCVASVVSFLAAGQQFATAADAVVLRPPTSAPVLDPFRLPDGPYGAGNRGIEYATRPGDAIRASAPGRVVFAGPVAGSLFVTVDHGDGLDSTYGFVASIAIRLGQQVEAGEVVALAGGPFHFGLRLHGAYVDPATRFARRVVRVELVAHHLAPRPVGPASATAHELAVDRFVQASGERASRSVGRLVRAGRPEPPATLLDGPFGPRTVPGRRRRNHFGPCHTRSPRRPARDLNREEGISWQSSP